MGLLSNGTPLHWSEASKHAEYVRQHGITQLLNIWHRLRTRRKDCLVWGDEVEYIAVSFDEERKIAKLSLKGFETLEQLEKEEHDAIAKKQPLVASWKPEYATYMLEGTPGVPYGSLIVSLLDVEKNMKLRRSMANERLPPHHALITLTSPPMLGVDDFLVPPANPTPLVHHDENSKVASGSLFVPDSAINPHPRFSTLTRNIRCRRNSKVAINMPIYRDTQTPNPFREPIPKSIALQFPPGTTLQDIIPDAKQDHVYMDCMAFGMGCSCLQITFQACSVEEARRLYDQLAVISPLMLAMTAAAPIYRGYLTDVDCRWSVISASVDDRTAEERGKEPLTKSRFKIPKSRYGSISSYLSPGPDFNGCGNPKNRPSLGLQKTLEDNVLSNPLEVRDFWKAKYNDIDLVIDPDIHKKLVENGMDEELARHFAHLFIRDPLVIYQELLEQDDEKSSDHFENIQSTNWQTMRFKPPPPTAPNTGWRVEFRSMEVQMTDFENAAFAIFIVLLTRTILTFGTNFYIPISKVDENLDRAHIRDANVCEKFFFRKNIFGKYRNIPSMLRFLNRARSSSPLHRSASQTSLSGLVPSPLSTSTSTSAPAPAPTNHQQHTCSDEEDIVVKETETVIPTPTRPNGISILTSNTTSPDRDDSEEDDDDGFAEMTMNEIFNGKPECNFPGLVPLVEAYLASTNTEPAVMTELSRYLEFISDRAAGKLMTTASWMRKFVTSHPSYQHDSKVPQDVIFELCKVAEEVGNGTRTIPEIVGPVPCGDGASMAM